MRLRLRAGEVACIATLATLLALLFGTPLLNALAATASSASASSAAAGIYTSTSSAQHSLLILVLSSPSAQSKRRRERARSSWVRLARESLDAWAGAGLTVRFVIATQPTAVSSALAAERGVWQDLVFVNASTRRSATRAQVAGAEAVDADASIDADALLLGGLVWSVRQRPQPGGFVHVTRDDTFVSVATLRALLSSYAARRVMIAAFAGYADCTSSSAAPSAGSKRSVAARGAALECSIGAAPENFPTGASPVGDAVLSRDVVEALVATHAIAPLALGLGDSGAALGVWTEGVALHRVHSRRFVSALDARRAAYNAYPNVCRAREWASQRVARSANFAKVMRALQRCPTITTSGAWRITAETDFALDVSLAANISAVLRGAVVADFGGGIGALCHYLEEDGRVAAVQCFDGAPGIAAITHGAVKELDLSTRVDLEMAFDWVVSLNVGVFIPARRVDVFLANIAHHATKGIILNWGSTAFASSAREAHELVPRGTSGVEMSAAQLGVALARLRFRYAPVATERLRRAAAFPSNKDRILVFVRE
jgi:hypothetical protein